MTTKGSPLVMEESRQGREKRTKEVSADMFDTVELKTSRKDSREAAARNMLRQRRTSNAELYHKGYAGDTSKKYLVPDTNLDEKRNSMNHRLRKSNDGGTTWGIYMENSEGDNLFQKNPQHLNERVKTSDESDSDETSEDEDDFKKKSGDRSKISSGSRSQESSMQDSRVSRNSDPNKKKEHLGTGDEETLENEFANEKKEKIPSVRENDALRRIVNAVRVSNALKRKGASHTESVSSVTAGAPQAPSLKVLISGHFRGNTKPIFIIHQYEGESPLENKNSDFVSRKRENNVDILMSGKFYRDSILEEVDGKPMSLEVKPTKIPIDERSKIYEGSFFHVIKTEEVDLEFEGSFIKHSTSKLFTPLISIGIKKHSVSGQTVNHVENKPSTMVYISKPTFQSPFFGTQKTHKARERKRCFGKEEESDFKFSSASSRDGPVNKLSGSTSYITRHSCKKSSNRSEHHVLEKTDHDPYSTTNCSSNRNRTPDDIENRTGVWRRISSMFS